MTSEPTTRIFKLVALADYQPGAVVSRQITHAEAGNVTLFAFDQGQELSEHSAPYEALLQILEGKAEVRLSGSSYPLCAGEAIILPARAPHAVRAMERCKMLLTMIRSA